MYINKLEIKNIRSISRFEMKFNQGSEAGWHVLIGDNGSGKTSVIQAISLGLVGTEQASRGSTINWQKWLSNNSNVGYINLDLSDQRRLTIEFKRSENEIKINDNDDMRASFTHPKFQIHRQYSGYYPFSAGYGAIRRFEGDKSNSKTAISFLPRMAAHLSVFQNDSNFSTVLEWLKELKFKELEKESNNKLTETLIKFINGSKLLPFGAEIERISSEGIFVKDAAGVKLSTDQLSSGFTSVLSIALDVIHEMLKVFETADKIFKKGADDTLIVDIPGIILIDEIDAHLHPTWQTKIGFWFTKYFPKIQFIVTTHSPLICRACQENGTIWRLAVPGNEENSTEITGTERERLVYGNILDAFGTEVFGQSPVLSEKGKEKLQRLGRLNMKSAFG